jgi:hypothetical protein
MSEDGSLNPERNARDFECDGLDSARFDCGPKYYTLWSSSQETICPRNHQHPVDLLSDTVALVPAYEVETPEALLPTVSV